MPLNALRSAIRRRRARLGRAEVAGASARVAHHLWRLPTMARCGRIACYLAVAGEIDCAPVMRAAIARGRKVYLPVVDGRTLWFAPWKPGVRLVSNRFGIPEPKSPAGRLRAAQLDVVLAPLVAFDDSGRRLGMGGGFYDRALAISRCRGDWRRPRVIGVAHEFQRVASLPARPWDIAMHVVVTEQGARIFRRG